MNKVLLALVVLSMDVSALAATYTVPAGSSAAAIQAIVNTAGNGAGNTVVFLGGRVIALSATVALPCLTAPSIPDQRGAGHTK